MEQVELSEQSWQLGMRDRQETHWEPLKAKLGWQTPQVVLLRHSLQLGIREEHEMQDPESR